MLLRAASRPAVRAAHRAERAERAVRAEPPIDAAGVPDGLQVVRAGGAPTEGGGAGGSPARDASASAKSFAYVSGYAAPISIFGLNLATGALTPAGDGDDRNGRRADVARFLARQASSLRAATSRRTSPPPA